MARPETPQPGSVTSPVLVGRGAELDVLAVAASSPPSLVLLEGEPGIGKTRLVHELVRHRDADGRGTLVAACHPVREPFPLGPLVEAVGAIDDLSRLGLSPLAGALAPLLPERAPELPAPPPPLGDPSAERHRVFRALGEVFGALGPSLLAIEDVHWADDGTIDFLRFLVSRPPRSLAVLLTFRREDLPHGSALFALAPRSGWGCERVALGPLETAQVGRMVAAILGADHVSDEFAAYLHDRTGGVPFAVEEVVRLLVERRDLVLRGGRWTRRELDRLRVPAGLRDQVLERLARLSRDARRIAEAAAILDVPADEKLLASVAAIAPQRAARGIAEALSSALMREDRGRATLRHALAQRAVQESIPGPRRRELHRRAATALSKHHPPPLARVAHHYRQSGNRYRWLRAAEAAADYAIAVGDDAAASRILGEAAADEDAPAAARARMAVKLGRAALHGLAHTEAAAVLRRVLDTIPMPAGVRGEIRLALWLLLEQAGAPPSTEEIQRCVEELRRRPELAARAMSALAFPDLSDQRVEAHLDWMRRAVEAASRCDDAAVRAAVAVNRASVLLFVGDPQGWPGALEIPSEGPVEVQRERVRGAVNFAWAAFHLGHYGAASAFIDEVRRRSEQLDYPRLRGAAETGALLLDWATGRWEGLEERAADAVARTEDVPSVAAEARLVLGRLAQVRGDPGVAERELSRALEACRTAGLLAGMALGAGGLAWLRLEAGDAPAALGEATPVLQIVSRKGLWAWASEVASPTVAALVATGRREEAAAFVRSFHTGLRRRDTPAGRSSLAYCRALLENAAGRPDAAAHWFARAARGWRALPRPQEAHRAREGLGTLRLDAGDERGTATLLEVLEGFSRLGASRDAARVRQTLRRHGVPLPAPWRGGRRGYGDRLSPREREVAELAGRGLTNREIANALFLSERTVAHHVERAMRKLGVRSRRQLAKDGHVLPSATPAGPFTMESDGP